VLTSAAILKQKKNQRQFREEENGNHDNDSVSRKRVEIEGLLFGISIQFSKMKIGHIEKAIEPPVGLGKKEVVIKKNILFS
jgi:hypothetical protein